MSKFTIHLDLDVEFASVARPKNSAKQIARWIKNYLKNVYIPVLEVDLAENDFEDNATVTRIRIGKIDEVS